MGGRGPGLTPSGDDLLAGVLGWPRASGARRPEPRFDPLAAGGAHHRDRPRVPGVGRPGAVHRAGARLARRPRASATGSSRGATARRRRRELRRRPGRRAGDSRCLSSRGPRARSPARARDPRCARAAGGRPGSAGCRRHAHGARRPARSSSSPSRTCTRTSPLRGPSLAPGRPRATSVTARRRKRAAGPVMPARRTEAARQAGARVGRDEAGDGLGDAVVDEVADRALERRRQLQERRDRRDHVAALDLVHRRGRDVRAPRQLLQRQAGLLPQVTDLRADRVHHRRPAGGGRVGGRVGARLGYAIGPPGLDGGLAAVRRGGR